MHRFIAFLGAFSGLMVSSPSTLATVVRFNTSVGSIDVRLYDTATPLSVANFLNYSESDRYVGTFIHRVPQSAGGGSSDFVVQGGGFLLNDSIFAATGIVTDAPIGNEPVFSNTRGTLSFAKNALGATSQWFFSIGDNSFLDDQDFTVFGRVLGDGMDIVDAINDLRTVNASAAENGPGEDFDEVPVTDFDQVIAQNDITSNEAVMVNSVETLDLPDGDYNFDGIVDGSDLLIWQNDFGSTVLAEADGNGDGQVNQADLVIWQNNYGATALAAISAVPEPGAAALAIPAAGLLVLAGRRRRQG